MDELKALNVSVLSASVDTGDEAKKVADGAGYPVGQGVTRKVADALGSWWDEKRDYMQPSEFVLDGEGKVLASSYSAGPLARMDPGDVIKLVGFFEKRKQQG